MAELVIRGGRVVDGTGEASRRADVAIDGDRVIAIGEGLEGAQTLDATGLIVAPGFIDIHTHYDAQVFWDPAGAAGDDGDLLSQVLHDGFLSRVRRVANRSRHAGTGAYSALLT